MVHPRTPFTEGLIAAVVLAAASASGQPAPTAAPQTSAMVWHVATAAQDFGVVAGPLEVGGQTVTGAPYSAEAVTETTRVLGDGTRLRHSTTTAIHRDSRGRTRREQGLTVIGSLVGGTDAPKQVVLTDPEAGVSYILDAERRRAVRLKTPTLSFTMATDTGAGSATSRITATQRRVMIFSQGSATDGPVAAGGHAALSGGASAGVFGLHVTSPTGAGGARTEPLGRETIEGVEAEGTRTTSTIPEGQMGNDRPIEIVSERWFSPHLKTLVRSRESNPLFGETTFHLANVVLAEPAASLFAVPSDYEIVDDGASAPARRIERRRR